MDLDQITNIPQSKALDELQSHHVGDQVTAGKFVLEILDAHPDYIDAALFDRDDEVWGNFARLGTSRSALDHLTLSWKLWENKPPRILTGRRVVLAMAMDPELAWVLLQSGVIASLLARWRPRARTGEEPNLLAWDLLSDQGRKLADEYPLLAAALGAPSEWAAGKMIDLPAEAAALAWSPSGDRLAILAQDVVYEARARRGLQRLDAAPAGAVALGWTSHGVVALCRRQKGLEVRLIPDGGLQGERPISGDPLISGDGLHVWSTDGALECWAVREPSAEGPFTKLGPPSRPLAVDWAGRAGVVERKGRDFFISTTRRVSAATASSVASSGEPDHDVAEIALRSSHGRPCAMTMSGGVQGVASAGVGGGVEVEFCSGGDPAVGAGVTIASIATGKGRVTALASDQSGSLLAVAVDCGVGVWSLGRDRRPAGIPHFDSDQPTGGASADMVDADRDARALAELIASEALEPPIAIGLFGAWGSGKSFVLNRIESLVGEITETAPEGYLRYIPIVRFNAWHYAETNLWASLVDEVLRKIGPAAPISPPPEVGKAEELVTAKRESVRMVEERVGEEERKLTRASRRHAWRSRLLLLLLWAIALAVVAVVVWRLNGHDLWRGLTLTVGALTAMLVVLRQAQQAAKEVRSVVTDGRERGRTLAKWGSAKDVNETAQNLRIERRKLETAQAEADLALRAAAHAKEIASSTDLGSVLARVSGETEYRDQLSVITRTRERFKSIDKAVNAARDARKARSAQAKPPTAPVEADKASTDSGTPGNEEQLDRVVIVIDDLDRCPPEKVVTVLEAVHLLFDFRIFVVILAVDTRWLEQSLLIRYRKLLGATAKASPADYLEKVIQIPLHLVHLDPGLVRRMLSGLTGAAVDASERAGGSAAVETVVRSERDESQAHERARLRGQSSRPERDAVPAQPLQISSEEAVAMSAVAPLIGTTPRTVKRFVNTYRLLKGRAFDAVAFDDRHEGLGDHEVVAFLLAVVTGHPVFAAHLLEALAQEPRAHNLQEAVLDLELPAKPKSLNASKQAVLDWLTERRAFADGKVSRYAYWAVEVGRFSFSPPARVPVDGPAHGPQTESMDHVGLENTIR